MEYTHLNQDRSLKQPGLTFWMVFALGFAVVLTIPMVGSLTGMPGHTCTCAPSCEATHWLNCPMDSSRPSSLRRKGGIHGSSTASSREPPALRIAGTISSTLSIIIGLTR